MNPSTQLTALAELMRDIDACYRGAQLLKVEKALPRLAGAYVDIIHLMKRIEATEVEQ